MQRVKNSIISKFFLMSSVEKFYIKSITAEFFHVYLLNQTDVFIILEMAQQMELLLKNTSIIEIAGKRWGDFQIVIGLIIHPFAQMME